MNPKRGSSLSSREEMPVLQNYYILEKIGAGSQAIVYKAVPKEGPREIVAIKSFVKVRESALREIELLKVLKHEHIVEMKSFFYEEGAHIVMEYCDGGDLSSFIRQRQKLPENVCRKFLQQLALALRYMRDHNICHMDLKPQNLLLVRKPCLTLKVADFGFGQALSNTEHKSEMRGSLLYMIPEMLLNQKYDARADLWSVGVIMYQCLFGRTPYSSVSFQGLVKEIKECRPIEIPKIPRISDECKDLLSSLLKHNPEQRITFENFFSHPFLDLEHAPTKENYEKAVKLVQEAIKMDMDKEAKEAFHLYCKALRYFIPLLHNESDRKRKEILRSHITHYINRAEKLKLETIDNDNDGAKQNNRRPGFCSQELRALGRSTTGMVDALEIGEAGEQYLAEGNYALALEKFQSSLSVLVPLLGKEPPGRRRNLLYKQVQLWLETAESTKGLLATKDMDSVQHDYEQW